MTATEDLLATATGHHHSGNFLMAARYYSQAIDADPRHPAALHQFGVLCHQLGQHQDAADLIRRAIELDQPANTAEYRANLAQVLLALGDDAAALAAAERARELGAPLVATAAVEADALRQLGRQQQAIEILTAACDSLAEAWPLQHRLAMALQEAGRRDEAIERYILAVELNPRSTASLFNLTRLMFDGQHEFDDAWVEHLQHLLTTLPAPTDQMRLAFALAACYEQRECYAASFQLYQRANELRLAELRAKRLDFDPAAWTRNIDEQIRFFSPPKLAELSQLGNPHITPVFIVGLPRSGTTLAEQLLGRHPQIRSVGEGLELSSLLKRVLGGQAQRFPYPQICDELTPEAWPHLAAHYLATLGDTSEPLIRVINKLPANFLHLGFANCLFPRAKFIHCCRDRRDTLWSCYQQHFSSDRVASFASSLPLLEHYHAEYQRLMNHWREVLPPGRLYDLSYEKLVQSPATELSQVVEFLELNAVTDLLLRDVPGQVVRTASLDQVRRPVHQQSVGRWRKFLEPLSHHCPDFVRAEPAVPFPTSTDASVELGGMAPAQV